MLQRTGKALSYFEHQCDQTVLQNTKHLHGDFRDLFPGCKVI